MADWGMKITKPSKGVTSSSVKDYVLNSKYPNVLTYIVGTVSYTMPNEAKSQTNFTIAELTHDLGYKPYVIFYWQKSGSEYGADIFWEHQGSAPNDRLISIEADMDVSTFRIRYRYDGTGNTGLAGTEWNFKCYIFINKASV